MSDGNEAKGTADEKKGQTAKNENVCERGAIAWKLLGPSDK